MEKVITKTNSGQVTEFKAHKVSNAAPVITDEFTDGDGIRMYVCEPKNPGEDNRLFVAEVYDKNWNVKKGAILPKGTKGENQDPRYKFFR